MKRGNAFAVGSMNAFKSRYFVLTKDSPSTNPSRCKCYLNYYESEGGVLKGQIDLRELVAIDFSSKTDDKVGVPIEDLVVFKLQVSSGRRYVLAAEKEKAMDWVSHLLPFTIGCKLMRDWRFHFGVPSHGVITLRDWMNAAMVLYKLVTLRFTSPYRNCTLILSQSR